MSPLDVVSAIARSAAAEHSARVDSLTIASADAQAGRVELLIVVINRRDEARGVLLNLSRNEAAEFERDLRVALSKAIAADPDR